MTIVGCLILLLWLGLVPVAIGQIPVAAMDRKQQNIGFMWLAGYMLLWALFQVLCVGVLLLEGFLNESGSDGNFLYVVWLFGAAGGLLAVIGIVIGCVKLKKYGKIFTLPDGKRDRTNIERFFWSVFAVLLLIQLLGSIFGRYADGDDAYYVAVSTITESSGTMYKVQPYSVGSTLLDTRHSLAPFPIWIAFLARISGCHPSFVAHIAVAFTLIFMTYVIFGLIGELLLREKREGLPIFMSFMALLVMFGDYSIYTPENFMLARSRQGKAALGNIIIPMLILLFLMIFERYKEEKKTEWIIWILLGATVTAACLCSTLGTFLMCLFLSIIGVCAGFAYKKWEPVWKTALCCSPALVYAVLYFMVG